MFSRRKPPPSSNYCTLPFNIYPNYFTSTLTIPLGPQRLTEHCMANDPITSYFTLTTNRKFYHCIKSTCFLCSLFHIMIYSDQWASYQIGKIVGVHAPGMPGTFFPPPWVSDPDMHHDTCVTHVPWCMPGSLTSGFLWSRRQGKTFPAFPAHALPADLRIW